MTPTKRPKQASSDLDLSPYTGRWVALVEGRIVGVGHTAEEARYAAQTARPKERPQVQFVPRHAWQDMPLLQQTWQVIADLNAEALLVGGAVRDGLLGRPLHDLDFAVVAQVVPLAKAVAKALEGPLVLLDAERDIARVIVRRQEKPDLEIDFARRQGEDWEADLRARDFTINAIGLDPQGRYLDPLDGREDLDAARIRAASESAFRADPLRALRAVRLAAELDFYIEPQTVGWIRRDAPLLPQVSAERVRDELARIVARPQAARHLSLLDDLNLLSQVLPVVRLLQGEAQSPPHRWDVWEHTRRAVAAVEAVLTVIKDGTVGDRADELGTPDWAWRELAGRLEPLRDELLAHLGQLVCDQRDRRLALKLALLLHDIGKPATMSVGEDGAIHFYQHERIGANMAADWLRGMRFSKREIDLIHTLVAHHLRPLMLATAPKLSRRAVYRYFRATGPAGVEVALMSLADKLATWGPDLPARLWERLLNVVERLLTAHFERAETVDPPPLLNGRDLMRALELEPGPQIGRLLEAIREAQAVGQVSSQEEALGLARDLVTKPDDDQPR